jgi:hypothetical protein
LHDAGVRYIIIGGFAVNAHGHSQRSGLTSRMLEAGPGDRGVGRALRLRIRGQGGRMRAASKIEMR